MLFRSFLTIITGLALVTGLFSCHKEEIDDSNDPLIGTWVYDSYQIDSDLEIYKSEKELDPDKPGMIFEPGGKFTIRNIYGWCATPPVTYENYNGTWENISDSTTLIRYEWWGTAAGQDKLEKTFNIIRADDQELWIRYIF